MSRFGTYSVFVTFIKFKSILEHLHNMVTKIFLLSHRLLNFIKLPEKTNLIIVIFDEHVFWLKLLINQKLVNVTKAVFVTKTRQ